MLSVKWNWTVPDGPDGSKLAATNFGQHEMTRILFFFVVAIQNLWRQLAAAMK